MCLQGQKSVMLTGKSNIGVVRLTFAVFPVRIESVIGSTAALEMTRGLLDAEMLAAAVPNTAGVDG